MLVFFHLRTAQDAKEMSLASAKARVHLYFLTCSSNVVKLHFEHSRHINAFALFWKRGRIVERRFSTCTTNIKELFRSRMIRKHAYTTINRWWNSVDLFNNFLCHSEYFDFDLRVILS